MSSKPMRRAQHPSAKQGKRLAVGRIKAWHSIQAVLPLEWEKLIPKIKNNSKSDHVETDFINTGCPLHP